VADYAVGFLDSNGITAGGLPIATGAALAVQMRRQRHCVVSFFGEGGANQGTFHESINMAAIWRLPLIFICENNLYAMSTRFDEAFATPTIASRAAGYGIPGEVVDGTDFFAVRDAMRRAARRARAGQGPTLLEMQTYRYYGHSKSDQREYRTRDEEADWRTRDCIDKLRAAMQLGDDAYASLDAEVGAAIDQAEEFARQSPEPPVEDWDAVIYA
jgi:pyruvate dehydrogenase E1 component alpha subunit